MEQTELVNLIGKHVTARTWPDDDRGLPSREVTGILSRHWVAPLNYWQYSVGDVGVDSATILQHQDEL